MSEPFLDVLKQRVGEKAGQEDKLLERMAEVLLVSCERIASTLSLLDPPLRQELLQHIYHQVETTLDQLNAETHAALRPQRLPPDLLEWFRAQTSEAEVKAGIQDMRTTGGVPFTDVLERLQVRKQPA
jgi:hypothetical protein